MIPAIVRQHDAVAVVDVLEYFIWPSVDRVCTLLSDKPYQNCNLLSRNSSANFCETLGTVFGLQDG